MAGCKIRVLSVPLVSVSTKKLARQISTAINVETGTQFHHRRYQILTPVLFFLIIKQEPCPSSRWAWFLCAVIVVINEYSLAEVAVEIHGTSMCLEFLQQLFHLHRRGSDVIQVRCGRRIGKLLLSDLVVRKNVCSCAL